MSEAVSVVAVLRARPGTEQRMRAQAEAMREAGRREPGCLAYDNDADPADPARWVVVEEWADRASLEAHLSSPHLAESLELGAELPAGPPRMRILTEVSEAEVPEAAVPETAVPEGD